MLGCIRYAGVKFMNSGADKYWKTGENNLLVSFYIHSPVLIKSIQSVRRTLHVVSLQQKYHTATLIFTLVFF